MASMPQGSVVAVRREVGDAGCTRTGLLAAVDFFRCILP
jgi:hypothetical protein